MSACVVRIERESSLGRFNAEPEVRLLGLASEPPACLPAEGEPTMRFGKFGIQGDSSFEHQTCFPRALRRLQQQRSPAHAEIIGLYVRRPLSVRNLRCQSSDERRDDPGGDFILDAE